MFKLHPNGRITITAGDSAELDLRLFNKDSIWMRPLPEMHLPRPDREYPLLDGKGELLWKTIQVQEVNSEGPVWDEDSEGNKIPHMIDNQVPVYPHDLGPDMMWHDSEGHAITAWFKTFDGIEKVGDFDWPEPKASWLPNRWPWKYPSGYHQLQEELLRGKVVLRVSDMQGNIVLEKYNDEFVNTIFFLPEDTKYLPIGLYFYQLEYITDEGEDTEERQVIQDESFFEITKRLTVSEN